MIPARLTPRVQNAVNGEAGTSMVETALVLPAYCLLLFGIFSFSMMMVSYLSASYCLRLGSRYASMHSLTSMSPASAASLSNLVISNMFLPSGSAPAVSVSYYTYVGSAAGNYVGNEVILTVAWTQAINIPFYSTTLSLQTQTYRMITE